MKKHAADPKQEKTRHKVRSRQETPWSRRDWCGIALDDVENFPFFNNVATLDFPFITAQAPARNGTVGSAPPEGSKDISEYIDINSLVIPSCLQRDHDASQSQLEDDVTFVTEYKHSRCGTRAMKRPAVDRPPPRRNPKRQAKMKKATALNATGGGDDYKEATVKRTTRSTSASASTPSAGAATSGSTSLLADFKVWPVDGMHEKPTFNPVTKKLMKHPGAAPRRVAVGGRRRRKPAGDAATKRSEADEKREFASLAHHNLHYVLTYVNNVRLYNEWTGGTTDATPLLQNNMVKAADLLKDACIMYCIANDVTEDALAKYLDVVAAKEDVAAFLKGILEGADDGHLAASSSC